MAQGKFVSARRRNQHARRVRYPEARIMTEKQLAEFFVEQRVLQPSQADDVLGEVELNGKTVRRR